MTPGTPGSTSRTTRSEAETVALGAAMSRGLRAGDLVAVDGDLGAGKTRLVRGIAAGLGDDPDDVHSPTFVLHHVHRGGRVPLHHLDLFRLGEDADVVPLDLDTLLEDGVVCVEWASYSPLLDAYDPVRVRIATGDGDVREVVLGDGAPERVARAFRSWAATTGKPR